MPLDDHEHDAGPDALRHDPGDDSPRHRGGRAVRAAEWQTVCVIDSLGTGADLAHTAGLERLGLPELLLPARPTEGDDLGADWLLPAAERIDLVIGWAEDWIEGSLAPGQERVVTLDRGTAECRFRFGPAVRADDLDVALDDGTAVVPVAWSLTRRPPPRPPVPTAAARRRVDRWTARVHAVTAHRARMQPPVPPSPVLAAVPGRSGPMHAWVAARIDAFLAVDGPALHALATNARIADRVRAAEPVTGALLDLAHRAGRSGAVREAENAAELLVIGLSEDASGGQDGRISAWDSTIRRLTAGLPPPPAADVETAVHEQVREAVRLVLLAAVVGDLAPTRLMASAVGPWEWAVTGRPPGRPWLAPPPAREAVRALLKGVDLRELVLATVLPPEGPVPEQLQAALLIRGLQLTTAASSRERLLTPRQHARLTTAQARRAEEVAGTLLTLTAAEHVDPVLWEVVTAPLRGCVPGLPQHPPGQEWLL